MDGNDLLMGGGITSAKFPIKGTRCAGRVIAPPTTRQQTDMVTKEGKYFKNGDPMMQIVIRLQTEERDQSIDSDDGERALYIKGASIKRLREAVRKAGVKKIEPGGWLSQTYVGDEMPTGGAPQGAKIYHFEYSPPDADVPIQQPQAPHSTQSYSVPTSQAASPTTTTSAASSQGNSLLDNLNPEQRAALAALGYKS